MCSSVAEVLVWCLLADGGRSARDKWLLVSDVCGVKDNEIVVSLKYRTCPGVHTSEPCRSHLLFAFKNAFTLSSSQTSAALRVLLSAAALSDAQTSFVREVDRSLQLILAERRSLKPSDCLVLFQNICCQKSCLIWNMLLKWNFALFLHSSRLLKYVRNQKKKL